MPVLSTRLPAIGLMFAMTAALSAQSIADAARKTTSLPVDQSGKQFITLFDVTGVGNSGGVEPTVIITGRGYAGTLEDRRRSGMKSEPGENEFVSVVVADAKDPKLPRCMKLLIPEVFMEHVVQIGGVGRIDPPSPQFPHLPPTLRLTTLSECTAVPRL